MQTSHEHKSPMAGGMRLPPRQGVPLGHLSHVAAAWASSGVPRPAPENQISRRVTLRNEARIPSTPSCGEQPEAPRETGETSAWGASGAASA